MEIDNFIDEIGRKYRYNSELIEAIKRCVPAMIDGKTEEDINLLMDTLERVEIFTFEDAPSQEQIDEIKNQKLQERNNHVTFNSYNLGEYGNNVSPGAYVDEPVFDENMNIIDRVGFIYLTNLYSEGETAEFYKSNINLSHLIHELGHAWAAQKGEFVQEKNGDYIQTVGTAKFQNRVDRNTHTVEETGVEGLYVEEALNSIEEEKALYKILGVNDFSDIPGYVPSKYQGDMTSMMRHYIEKLGKDVFENIRIQKDTEKIEQLQEIFDQTDFMTQIKSPEYYSKKKEQFESFQNTSMSNSTKKKVNDFFAQYSSLYFAPHANQNFLQHLDTVMEQMYNFKSIKYSYDIFKEDILQAYKDTHIEMLREGYVPVNQASLIIEERKKQSKEPVTLSSLAKEALENNIREGEIKKAERQIHQSERQDTKEENVADGQDL